MRVAVVESNDNNFAFITGSKDFAVSVRCVKD
jgi:hypothetical protein